MTGRRRSEAVGHSPETSQILARLAQAARDVPPPSLETISEMRARLLREVRTQRGRTQLQHKALASMVALLLRQDD